MHVNEIFSVMLWLFCNVNVRGPFLYSPQCLASPLVPSLCEIVQPMQRGILSDTDQHWYAHTANAADIWYVQALSLHKLCHYNTHTHTQTSASALWRYNLAAFCEMVSLWRQMGEVHSWIERRWIGSSCLCVCVSLPLLSVGLCMLAHSCLQRSVLPFTFIFHSASAEKMQRPICYTWLSIVKLEIMQWMK